MRECYQQIGLRMLVSCLLAPPRRHSCRACPGIQSVIIATSAVVAFVPLDSRLAARMTAWGDASRYPFGGNDGEGASMTRLRGFYFVLTGDGCRFSI